MYVYHVLGKTETCTRHPCDSIGWLPNAAPGAQLEGVEQLILVAREHHAVHVNAPDALVEVGCRLECQSHMLSIIGHVVYTSMSQPYFLDLGECKLLVVHHTEYGQQRGRPCLALAVAEAERRDRRRAPRSLQPTHHIRNPWILNDQQWFRPSDEPICKELVNQA